MRSLFLPLLASLLVSAAPSTAVAKFIMVTRGDSFSHLGDIAANQRPPQLLMTAVGYKYSYFGVFWIDLWRYNGEYCLYSGKDYIPLTRSQAAAFLDVPEDQLSEPFFYQVPPGLIVIGSLVVIGTISTVAERSRQRRIMELVSDPTYGKALEIFRNATADKQAAKKAAAEKNEPEPADLPDPWQSAIAYLESEGLDKADAEKQFGKVLAYALQRASSQETPTGET